MLFEIKTLDDGVVACASDFLTAKERAAELQHSSIETLMEYDAAIGFMKALRGYNWYVRVETWAPTIEHRNQGFKLYANIRATRKEALRTLDTLYGTRFKKECLVRLTILSNSVFVG